MNSKELTIWRRQFRYWFDRSVRVWYAIELDSKGNQIGETIDSNCRDMLLVFIGVRSVEKKDTAHAN